MTSGPNGRGDRREEGKRPNQDWQHCPACGAWWPVDTDFRTLGAAVLTECPRCGSTSPFAPRVSSADAGQPSE